jgi:hypothetical protein
LPQYVSSATQSVVITIAQLNGSAYNGSPASFATNLTTSSPNCSGSPLACTLSVSSPVGSVTFLVATYDAQQSSASPSTPSGNVLSQASLTLNVTTGGSNSASLVLGGVPASFSAVPSGTGYFTGNATALAIYGPIAQTLTLNALDASGQTIIGQGAPTLSLSSISSSVALANISANVFQVQATTSGSPAAVTPGTIALTAMATPAANTGSQPFSATIQLTIAHSAVYVSTGGSVDLFYDGNTSSPNMSITSGINAARGVAVDANGAIYVANHGNGSVTEYPAGQTTPSVTLTMGLTYPEGVAIDVSGNLWVAESSNGDLIEFLAGATTGTGYSQALSTGFSSLRGIAIDSSSNMWITNQSASPTLGYIPVGSLTPTITTSSSLSAPIGVAIGVNGYPWVSDSGGSIDEFTPPFSNGMSPQSSLSSSHLPSPVGMAIDAGTGFWIADSGTGYVVNCLPPYGAGGCSNAIADSNALWVAVVPAAQP